MAEPSPGEPSRPEPSPRPELAPPAEAGDADDVLERALLPGERVVWLADPDRAAWRRLASIGMGCLPFVGLVAAVAAGTFVAGTATVQRLPRGNVEPAVALAASLGVLLLSILLYPIVADELARRERRYVLTTRRALVLGRRRVESALELSVVSASALHAGLFDDAPTGVALRRVDGTAGIVFRDLEDPLAARSAIEAALALARAASTP